MPDSPHRLTCSRNMSKLSRSMSSGSGNHDGPNPRQGRRLQPFFTAVCIYVRERSDSSHARIADLAGLGEWSIKRFEDGETWPAEKLERYAAAYAYDAKIDGRDLIALAVNWWTEHGKAPLTPRQERELESPGPDPTAADVLDAIRRAEKAPGEDERPPSATRKRRRAVG